MTRHFFWIAAATVLTSSLVSYEHRALAQQGEASAEAEADTSDASADASAETDAAADASADTSTEADTQADTQAGTDDGSATADAQSDTQAEAQTESTDASASSDSATQAGEDNANAPLPQPSNEAQEPASDPQAAPSSDDPGNQPADQEAPPSQPQDNVALPPPSDTADPNVRQPREQSRLRNPQDDQRDGATRDRDDRSDRSRINVDVRRGIEFGRGSDRGLIVNNIEQNSFYYNSGIRRGDIIVSVHGRAVRNHDDFMRFIILQPGQRVPVVVLRDGRRETIYVQYRDIAHRHPVEDERQYRAGGAYLGVVFDAQYPDAAVVLRTNPGSPAQEAGLQAGDILVALNGQEVGSYQDAISAVRSMRPGDKLEIIFERARTEREALAMLDAQPNVRTANRPGDVRVEQQYTPGDQPDDVRIDVNRRNDYDRSRDGRYEEGGRRLLPRLRN
jgi:hypothetical protein